MTREEFQASIDASELSSERKQLWNDILLMLDDSQVTVFSDLVVQDPDALQLLTKNIEMKKEAFRSSNKDLFSRVLETEKATLE